MLEKFLFIFCPKTVKGTMFFYLYHCKTHLIDWMKLVLKQSSHLTTSCLLYLTQNCTFYILVDGRPTKDKIVWQSLVDIDNVKLVVEKLRDTNLLYRSVDETAKKAVEVVNSASNLILERASEDDFMVYRATPFVRWTSICRQVKTLTITSCSVSMNSLWITVKSYLTFCASHPCFPQGGMVSFILYNQT